jgi:hypothetical protein
MSHLSSLYEIQKLIARDEMIEAIARLLAIAKEEKSGWAGEAIVLSMELWSLKKASHAGKVTWAEELATKRALAYRMTEILRGEISSGLTAFEHGTESGENFFLKRA